MFHYIDPTTNVSRRELDISELPDLWHARKHMSGEGVKFAGGTVEQCDALIDGKASTRVMRDIERKLSGLQIDVATPGAVIEHRPYGSSPCVPSFLAGSPNSMRRTALDADSCNPVRVFFAVGCSEAISTSIMRKRAVCAAALVLALAEHRPTELVAVSASSPAYNRDTYMAVRFGFAPFDSAQLALLCNPMMLRRVAFAVERIDAGAESNTCSIGWPKVPLATLCEPTESDVIIAPLHVRREAAFLADPAGWVKEQLVKALSGSGAAYENYHEAPDR